MRALEHVRRLVDTGVDSLKIEERTKSTYYATRTAQVYRRAIDDAVAGRPSTRACLVNLKAYPLGFGRFTPTIGSSPLE